MGSRDAAIDEFKVDQGASPTKKDVKELITHLKKTATGTLVVDQNSEENQANYCVHENNEVIEEISPGVIDPTASLIMIQGHYVLHLIMASFVPFVTKARPKLQCF